MRAPIADPRTRWSRPGSVEGRAGIKEIDVPVRKLDDAEMLAIMSRENMDEWAENPAVLCETVLKAKEFIDAELEKCEKLADFKKSPVWRFVSKYPGAGIDGERAYQILRGTGSGAPTIGMFTGIGEWNEKKNQWRSWKVEQALATLRATGRLPDPKTGKVEKVVDEKAMNEIPTSKQQAAFRDAVRKVGGLSSKKQRQIAKQARDEMKEQPDRGKTRGSSLRNITELVVDAKAEEEGSAFTAKNAPQRTVWLDDAVKRIAHDAERVAAQMSRVRQSEAWPDVSEARFRRMVQVVRRITEEARKAGIARDGTTHPTTDAPTEPSADIVITSGGRRRRRSPRGQNVAPIGHRPT